MVYGLEAFRICIRIRIDTHLLIQNVEIWDIRFLYVAVWENKRVIILVNLHFHKYTHKYMHRHAQ